MNPLAVSLTMDDLDFATSESIKMLRGNVQMAGYDCKTIAITSALPNEGKSFVAFRLASSLADMGAKTVFVDCDIRNSCFKSNYRIAEETVGLSEYLCGHYSENDLVYSTNIDNLGVVFSGKTSPKPSELLSGRRFEHLLAYLKKTYDYAILDTPPVNLLIDGTLIAKKSDTTILVIKSHSTEREAAVQLKKQLEMSGVNILGVVMNLCGAQKGEYGYGYGYGYDSKEERERPMSKGHRQRKRRKDVKR